MWQAEFAFRSLIDFLSHLRRCTITVTFDDRSALLIDVNDLFCALSRSSRAFLRNGSRNNDCNVIVTRGFYLQSDDNLLESRSL